MSQYAKDLQLHKQGSYEMFGYDVVEHYYKYGYENAICDVVDITYNKMCNRFSEKNPKAEKFFNELFHEIESLILKDPGEQRGA